MASMMRKFRIASNLKIFNGVKTHLQRSDKKASAEARSAHTSVR